MEDKELDQKPLNPWHPITNSVELKYLGKLLEEVNELGCAISRCIIQGVNENEPVTNKLNKEWLEDEMSDVMANMELVINKYNLDRHRMYIRGEKKKKLLKTWHDMA